MLEFTMRELSAEFRDAVGNPVSRVQQVRTDFTGFEIASGEMATFTLPETVAEMARLYW